MARVFIGILALLSLAAVSSLPLGHGRRRHTPKGSWSDQFKTGAAIVKAQYGFTVWKNVDWDARAALALKEIEAAEANKDEEALFWAIRKYTFVGDGHIGTADPGQYFQRSVNGSYGLIIAHDDTGKVIVVDISPEGPAYAAGVRKGAEVQMWNGKPVADALAAIPHWKFFQSNPTPEGQQYERELILTRGPLGQTVEAGFVNTDGSKVSANMTTHDDKRMGLIRQLGFDWPFGGPVKSSIPNEYGGPARGIQSHLINGPNVGYLRIMTEDTTKGNAPELVQHAANAVALFTRMGARGVIVDLRGNNGGDDQPAADLVSLFYTGNQSIPYPYKDIHVGDVKPPSQQHKLTKCCSDAIPSLPYRGQLAVIADHLCVSDCEGIAYSLRHMIGTERTKYFSWDNSTMGAFGMVDEMQVPMPNGNDVTSLMKQDGTPLQGRKFLIEANEDGYGGIPADVMIPRTAENLLKRYNGVDLPLQAAVDHLSSFPSNIY